MATSQAAYAAEKILGHEEEYLKQDVSNYRQTGDPNETMKALVWQGKQKVEVGTSYCGSTMHTKTTAGDVQSTPR